jgi:hypothetical protein
MSKDKKNNTGVDNTGTDNSGNWNSGNWNSGNRNSGYGNSGNRNSGYGNSGYGNSGDWNSGDRNSGDRNSGNRNSGYGNSGNWNSGYGNSGYGNSGDWNSGDRNSGIWNSGDWNSGIFNTNEPKMRAFNKETDMTYTEFRNKFGYMDIDFPLNIWIDAKDMTDQEKEDHVGWETTEGYLKTLSYKEAWQEGWKNATQEQKDWYKNLPNFDAGIFKEITEIDVKDDFNLKGEEVEVSIKGKKYRAIIQ